MRRFFFLLSALLFTVNFLSAGPKHEMRGAWLATVYGIDWPSVTGTTEEVAERQRHEFDAILDTLQMAGINAVFMQVRPMADALYRTDKEPWSSYLTGSRGTAPADGWDPLAYAVNQAHSCGMELHAWVNPFRFWSEPTMPSTPQDNASLRKGLIITHRPGRAVKSKKRGRKKRIEQPSTKTLSIFDPSNDAAVEHVVEICRDIIKRYDVDGLVFDDYFYPDGFPLPADDDPDMAASRRRKYVNSAIAKVYAMIQKEKPYVRFGVSPAGVAGGNGEATARYNILPPTVGNDWMYDRIYCDPLAWLEEGTVDYVSPQLYWPTDHSTNPYGPLAQWWKMIEEHFHRHVYASHSLTGCAATPAHWREQGLQIDHDRESRHPGTVLYSVSSMTGRKASGLASYLGNNHFAIPALLPAMTWKRVKDPGKVTGIRLDRNEGRLTWTGNSARRYVVYAIPDYISEEDATEEQGRNYYAGYILGVTYQPEITVPSYLLEGYRYAVAPYDRYGNEWPSTLFRP